MLIIQMKFNCQTPIDFSTVSLIDLVVCSKYDDFFSHRVFPKMRGLWTSPENVLKPSSAVSKGFIIISIVIIFFLKKKEWIRGDFTKIVLLPLNISTSRFVKWNAIFFFFIDMAIIMGISINAKRDRFKALMN
jgi:hypothetical protein